MKNKIRRSIAAVCAVAAVCAPLAPYSSVSDSVIVPVVASAAGSGTSGVCSGTPYTDNNAGVQLYYKTKNNGIVITGCKTTKEYTNLYIPKHINGKDVIEVDDNAFKDQTGIQSVYFYGTDTLYKTYYSPGGAYIGGATFVGGSSIAKIGKSAFEGCTELKFVRVGDKKITIKDYAFEGCTKLESFYSFDTAGNYTGNRFESIGLYAFEGTNLKSFDCAECGTIGYEAFNECANLKKINVTATTVGNRCFQMCGSLTDVTIKADSIGEYCFSRSYKVTSADLDVKKIKGYAFSGCSKLKNLNLVNTEVISQNAFENCTELKEVAFPKTLKTIGKLAFLGDTKLSSPLAFIRENGESLYIGIGAFNNTAVEYLVLSGDNITLESYAFCRCNLKAAVIEGDVELNSCCFNYSNENPGFTMYGDADSNAFAERWGIPYVKVDKSQSYDKIMNDNKKYFMGINTFAERGDKEYKGSCAGMSIMQMFVMTGKTDLSTLLPSGQDMIDIPADAYVDHMPEYSTFCDTVIDYHSRQLSYLDYNYSQFINSSTIEAYSKLTEYGITTPGVLRIKNHRHVVTFLGIEKLDPPVVKYDALAGQNKTYNYRVIMSDSGYRFKYDENGNLLARGADSRTWKPGWTDDMGWIPVEETYMYLSTSEETYGDCYTARYEHEENLKPDCTKTTFDELMLLPASTVKER